VATHQYNDNVNLLFLHSVVEGRTYDPPVFSPGFTISRNKIHAPTPTKLSLSQCSSNERTYSNPLVPGLMKLFLVPPSETCLAMSRLEEYKIGGPLKKGTKNSLVFPPLVDLKMDDKSDQPLTWSKRNVPHIYDDKPKRKNILGSTMTLEGQCREMLTD